MTAHQATASAAARAEGAGHGTGHLGIVEPEPWVVRFAHLVPPGGPVLDVACGNGRHARYMLDRGHPVVLIDRDVGAALDLAADPRAEVIEFDLEAGRRWPLPERRFAAVIVVNYLFRPLFPHLIAALEDDGVLIYDTFARGNERYSRPRNPDHLLRAGELLDVARGALTVVAYEYGLVERASCPGVKERLCAVRWRPEPARDDSEPTPLPLSSPWT